METMGDGDTLIRIAAFGHVRKLEEIHDHLTANELKPGFVFLGQRLPLINPQRGIGVGSQSVEGAGGVRAFPA